MSSGFSILTVLSCMIRSLRSSFLGGAACKSDTRYFIWMPKKDRKPKARPSGEKWFVYIVRCADGSLYTGITKDVTRRCQQHNAGTASRYTRSRRPVKLISTASSETRRVFSENAH